ncbi:hypothetical protein HYFRA_00013358 [Hymenoscyphus fraxineus]|uniref:Uncharacterized protein n=1 Tax=Hymenoscyphus fraxineus TaxID=746836 RepID=A0A9N9LBX5_9HELO|nr:hypothetical protein HYFRA_00013358 [Hymenoscyphus fraxineus]
MLVPNVFTAAAVLSAFVVGLPLGASNDALIQPQSIATGVDQEDPSLDKRAKIRFTTGPIGPVAKTKFKIGRSESRPAGHVTRRTDDNADLAHTTSPPDEGGILTKRVLGPIPEGRGPSTQLPPWFPRFTKHPTNAKRRDVVDSVSDEDTTAPLAKRIAPWGESPKYVKGGSIELTGRPIPPPSRIYPHRPKAKTPNQPGSQIPPAKQQCPFCHGKARRPSDQPPFPLRLQPKPAQPKPPVQPVQTTKASDARVVAPVGPLKTMERISSKGKPKEKPEAAG